MEYIKESFNALEKHLKNNSLSKDKKLELILSLSPRLDENKIYIFYLGLLVDREKTQNQKVYRIKSEYKIADNYFDVYFGLYCNDLDDLALISKILVDFEESENIKFRLLNSKKELQDNLIIENFMKLSFDNVFLASTTLFIKVNISAKSLKEIPKKEVVHSVGIHTTQIN